MLSSLYIQKPTQVHCPKAKAGKLFNMGAQVGDLLKFHTEGCQILFNSSEKHKLTDQVFPCNTLTKYH